MLIRDRLTYLLFFFCCSWYIYLCRIITKRNMFLKLFFSNSTERKRPMPNNDNLAYLLDFFKNRAWLVLLLISSSHLWLLLCRIQRGWVAKCTCWSEKKISWRCYRRGNYSRQQSKNNDSISTYLSLLTVNILIFC